MYNCTYISTEMSKQTYPFAESNLPYDTFSYLPLIPVQIQSENGILNENALIDTGANCSFIQVKLAEALSSKITGSMSIGGLTGKTDIVATNIILSCDPMDGNWCNLFVGITPQYHPNFRIILGRNFLENFKITYNGKNAQLDIEHF